MDKYQKLYYDEVMHKEVIFVAQTLQNAGFEAFLVGGCVRDLILGREPKDWDLTTNATPDEIISLFPKTFYENTFGTVGVVNEAEGVPDSLKIIEVTPYRLETTYSDNRHPDAVTFSKSIKDDLQRRDFTVNAIAQDPVSEEVVDLYGGEKDIKDKVIRTVGGPADRFREDALRIMRAIRLATELGFTINIETKKALKDNAELLKNIAKERIRDEFVKIVMSDEPMKGLLLAEELGILKYITPELEKGIGVTQNQAHAYTVWEHLLRSMQHAADKGWPLEIRLAALFHDVAKPHTKRSGPRGEATFYGHEVVGARVTKKILEDLRFPKKTIDDVTKLVRWHMFFADTEQITLSAVRRMITNVGKDLVWTLMDLRICDRVGTGRPKENPYRLRKYKAMVEEAMRDPLTVGMLKLDGNRLLEVTQMPAGPKVGHILHALLEEVLEDPKLNTAEHLEKEAKKLAKMSEEDLKKLGDKGKKRKEKEEEGSIEEIRKKYFVK